MSFRAVVVSMLVVTSVTVLACSSDSEEAESCPSASCGGFCVDLDVDTSNCGKCGAVCPSEQTCVSGHCITRRAVDASASDAATD